MGFDNGKFIRGDSIEQDIILKSNGTPINLTGGSIKFSIKKNYNQNDYIYSTTASITDAVNGKCHISVDKNITKLWGVGSYYYDIEFTDSLGLRYTPVIGVIQVIYDITN